MNMMIENYMVVRFSIVMPETENIMWANATRKIAETFSDREDWFKHRADLFSKTYSTFIAQTKPLKKIILVFDHTDQVFYTKYIKPNFDIHPVFDVLGNWKDEYTNYIKDVSKTNVVISRVDSDDLIEENYVEAINQEIQRINNKNQDLIVIAPYGEICDGIFKQKIIWNVSPFTSLYCPIYKKQDIYAHSHMLSLNFTHSFAKNAHWVQRVHGTNVDNKFRYEQPGFSEMANVLFENGTDGELKINKITIPFLNAGPKILIK
jgi:hypothetical protein